MQGAWAKALIFDLLTNFLAAVSKSWDRKYLDPTNIYSYMFMNIVIQSNFEKTQNLVIIFHIKKLKHLQQHRATIGPYYASLSSFLAQPL